MGIYGGFQRVLDNNLEEYTKPRCWEISDAEVVFKPVAGGIPATEWKETLEEWLPKYDDAGMLDGMRRIYIGKGVTQGDAVGEYNTDKTISLENELENEIEWKEWCGLVHDGSREAVLTHEVIHHAHLTINGFDRSHCQCSNKYKLKQSVSTYAGTNIGEAVAEIGTGIVHGVDFEPWVHEYYEKKDGPQGVYEIG